MTIFYKAFSGSKRGKGLKNSQSRFEQMLAKLEEHGFRITPQRIAVLRVLAASEDHPSVEMIYEKVRREFPTTSLATIYKTVTLLREMNEVLELGFPEGSNRYDGHKPYPHPHVICTKCRKIIDPDLERLTDLKKELVSETGFQITSHRLDFFGICPDCQKKTA
jgi:Fur family transcriptional regulator, peroxide stress response regulator